MRGRTFLTLPTEDGVVHRARVAGKILDDPDIEDPSYENVKFLLHVDGHQADQIVGYNHVVEQLNHELEQEELYNTNGEQWYRL